jgi:hypothetical protein
LQKALVALVVLSLAACGNPFQKDKAQSKEKSPGTLSLIGVANTSYAAECEDREDGKSSEQDSLILFDSSFERRWSSFEGTGCNPELRNTTYIYRYENVQEEVRGELEGYKHLLVDAGQFTATLHTVGLAKAFSRRNNYGYSDWVANQPKEINGRRYDEKSSTKWPMGEDLEFYVAFESEVVKVARFVEGAASSVDPIIFKKQ